MLSTPPLLTATLPPFKQPIIAVKGAPLSQIHRTLWQRGKALGNHHPFPLCFSALRVGFWLFGGHLNAAAVVSAFFKRRCLTLIPPVIPTVPLRYPHLIPLLWRVLLRVDQPPAFAGIGGSC